MSPLRARVLRVTLALLPLLAALGCWNSNDIQNQAYVTAIGLDYEKGQYGIYAQILNFGNVARTETATLGKPIPVWIGHTEARTLSDALSVLHRTSQMPLYWGHTKVLVVTERFLRERGIREAIRAMNRYREVRYNIYMYGTREKLSDLFVQKSIFNLSPLDTVMFSPKQVYVPITGNRFISRLDEPGNPAVLPSIGIDDKDWKEDKKRKPMLRIDGGFYFTNRAMTTWMSEEELKGARWAQRTIRDTAINVPEAQPFSAGIMVVKSDFEAKPGHKDGQPTFDVKVRAQGFVLELFEDVSVKRLEEMTAGVLRSEIRETFLKGVSKRCDPFALQQAFYRKFPREWEALGGAEEYLLKPDSLGSIDVKVKLSHMGKYKGRAN